MPKLNFYNTIFFVDLRKNLFFYSLMLLLLGLPLSKAMVSIAEALLVISWFVAPGFNDRVQILKQRKSIWVMEIAMIVVIAGLLYSDNLQRNVFLIFNIKIALLLFPIIFGTSGLLTKKQLSIMLVVFTGATLIATIVSSLILIHIIDYKIANVRNIAVFVESVRFGLIVVFDILSLLYAFLLINSKSIRVAISVIVIWLFIFLGILQSITGIMAIAITLIVLVVINFNRINSTIKWTFAIVFIACTCYFSFLIFDNLIDFDKKYNEVVSSADSLTINGNKYIHNFNDTVSVNGHRRGLYICETELRKQWPLRSNRSIDSLDNIGWVPIKETLILYLTSKGLKKDSAGIAALSKADIKNIESGYYNYKLAEVGINARIYDVIRETKEWWRTGKPAGSITIRINAMHNGWKIFKKNPWIGTGYGDINDDIQQQFEKDKVVFGEDMRQNPHNQFFTIMIGSGIIGLIVFLISYILPAIIERKYKSFLFLAFFCVITISFFSDDTLERMIGVVLMALFFCLALYSIPEVETNK